MPTGITSEYIERLGRVAKANRIPAPDEQPQNISTLRDFYQSRLNWQAFVSAEPWMRPYWVTTTIERNRQPRTPEEGFPNISYRNWAIVGGVGSRSFAITDKKGLLTASPDCGSIEFWPSSENGPVFPALEESAVLELLSPEDQVFEMTILSGPVEFRRLVYHAVDDDMEVVYNEIVARNYTLEKTRFDFYMAVRPMSVAGVEPIENLKFDLEKGILYVNGFLACAMDRNPSAVVMSTADNPNLLSAAMSAGRMDQEYSTPRGLGTAIMRFTIELPPAGSERFFFTCPIAPPKANESIPQFEFETTVRDKSVERWFDYSGPGLASILPERHLSEALAQAKASLVSQSRSFINECLASPDLADWYEVARVLHALITSGCSDLAMDLAQEIDERANSKGAELGVSFHSPFMWTILRSFNSGTLSNHQSWAREMLIRGLRPILSLLYQSIATRVEPEFPEPVVVKEVEEIEQLEEEEAEGTEEVEEIRDVEERESPKSVEPEWIRQLRDEVKKVTDKNPAEDSLLAKEGELVEHDDIRLVRLKLWSIEVLKLARDFLKDVGESDKSLLIVGFLVYFEKDLKSALDSQTIKSTSMLDALHFLSDMALLGVAELSKSDSISDLLSLARTGISSGLIRLQGPPQRFSSHLSLRLAHFYVSQKQRYDAEVLLEKALENLSDYHTLPEYVDPKSGGGSFGSGSSMLAAADLFLLARGMILVEEGPSLILLPGIPEDWYTSSTGLTIKRIPTNFGPLDFEMGASANQYQMEVSMTHLPEEIDLHVPMSFSIPLVKVFGAGIVGRFPREDSPYVKVVPLTERVVFTFHR
ncbi:MAG: hypothetical protein JSW61_14080 [Candidatus Thorarchaeota archaeon]|nr:MAG: hypothetical protein JSW61_14080 [Candidatus Thorarchaeota archaeon]